MGSTKTSILFGTELYRATQPSAYLLVWPKRREKPQSNISSIR